MDDSEKERIIREFSLLYGGSCVTHDGRTSWLGVPTVKIPLDLWIYQEIIYKLRPDLIIEAGTAWGGSALYLACICEMVDSGRVLTIDVAKYKQPPNWRCCPDHLRIEYLYGSSTSQSIVDSVASSIGAKDKVMVILDSDHGKGHVLSEMSIYSTFVTVGQYLIVEDTNVNGHPALPNFGPGPWEAVEEFLKTNDDFVIDKTKEKFFLTSNPNGYLLRTK